jgi:nucleoside-diphosphate-sugar epimerase
MDTKPRALITGINGFTGRYVAEELKQAGYEVYGLGNQASSLPNYHQVNLLSPDALSIVIDEVKPQVVVHLAAIAFVAHGNADDFYHVNIIGTRNLLAALAKHATKIEAVLIASSANVYGNQAEGKLSELKTPNPSNDYAVSKLAMEYMAKTWSEQLPIFITRPFNYTGRGQSPQFLIPKVVSHFKNRQSVIELGNIDVWRDFNDVRNVAKAYNELIQKRPIGETINICTGTSTSLREIIKMAETICNHKIHVVINPDFVRSNEVKVLCGSPDKLMNLTNMQYKYSLEETLRWMLENTE